MKTKMVTRALLEKLGACWYDNGKEAGDFVVNMAAPGVDEMSITDVLELDTVNTYDRIWLGIQFLSRAQKTEFACRCAERVLHHWVDRGLGREPALAIAFARRFLAGVASSTELSEHIDAVEDAIYRYARGPREGEYCHRAPQAAKSALYAARTVSRTWSAGRAYSAARSAHSCAAGEYQIQLDDLKARLK